MFQLIEDPQIKKTRERERETETERQRETESVCVVCVCVCVREREREINNSRAFCTLYCDFQLDIKPRRVML